MVIWKSVVGKLWMTIIGLVALVLLVLGMFLLEYLRYIDIAFINSYDVKKLFVYTAIIGFLLTTFFAFFLSTRITRPLLQMKKAADLITLGEYATRVPVQSTDEIGELAKTMNHMAAELEETIKDLNNEKEHLSSVLRSMTDAVITFSAGGEVILANPQGEKIIREWNEIARDFSDSEQDETNQVPEPLQTVFQSVIQGKSDSTTKINIQNGVWSVVMAPLYSNNAVRGAVGVLRDITEEYRLEKLRKDFVANVSHELRTPLSMLQGYSEALLDNIAGTQEERREIAQVINDESLRMVRLVGDLLDLARMEGGFIDLNLAKVDLKTMLPRIHRKFLVLCRERGIELELDMSGEDLILNSADEDRLEQVFTNLLDNAIRHTPAGAEIVIRAFPLKKSGRRMMRIEVEDHGQGIPPDDLPFIFERFYKADKARKRNRSTGTGLGLAIVKNIIEAHRGTIHVKSEWGHGTTFSIMIPVNRPQK